MDLASRRVTNAGTELELSRKEFDLLSALMSRAGKVVRREDLMSEVWDENWFGSTKTLDTHIGWLRRKLCRRSGRARLHPHREGRRLQVRRARGDRAISLRSRLLLALAYVVLLALVAFGVPLALSLRDRVDAEVQVPGDQPGGHPRLHSLGPGASGRSAKLATLAREGGASVRGRVIVVDRTGTVLADSGSTATVGRSYAGRPEITAALAGRNYQKSRRSNTLSADILATATPVRHNGVPVGAVRVTQSIASVNRAVWRTIGGLALIGAVVLLLGLAAGVVIAGQVARPLGRLNVAVRRIAHGDLEVRAPVEGSSEQRSLAASFNEMTERLAGALKSQRRFVG